MKIKNKNPADSYQYIADKEICRIIYFGYCFYTPKTSRAISAFIFASFE